MHILEILAESDFKVELIQPHSGSPAYIEILKIVFSWPVVILAGFLFLALKSGDSLRKFLENLGEFTFKAGGVEASFKRQLEAAALLGAAQANRQVSTADQQPVSDETARDVAHIVRYAARPVSPSDSARHPFSGSMTVQATTIMSVRPWKLSVCASLLASRRKTRSKRYALNIST